MPRSTTAKKYGKSSKRTKAERLFAELPQSPVRLPPRTSTHTDETDDSDSIAYLTKKISSIAIEQKEEKKPKTKKGKKPAPVIKEESIPATKKETEVPIAQETKNDELAIHIKIKEKVLVESPIRKDVGEISAEDQPEEKPLRVLTWNDVCPLDDRIDKIAEASYAEVYRVTNDRGVSIIKVIRLPSPIKPQTKAQVRSGLVDEEPHPEEDVQGELQISEWLADIPGFVIYKERYIVQGKTSKQLLETHQAFQKRMKRQDPDRAQFYPSPSRYLDDTRFLVVELGDAGTALEDWEVLSESQLWDIFLLEAIALARAEDLAMFEHRDLHEGNLCIKQVKPPRERRPQSRTRFGYSGLDITILDYGLSRAEDLSVDDASPVAFDLERDLSLFTSTHASQCKVYRQMRSFLLRADRKCLPAEAHNTPYDKGIDGALSWDAFAPYTNVLWLAYLYEYLMENFAGPKKELLHFKKQTAEMWDYLNPEADESIPCFSCAADIVCFAVEAGWMSQEQLVGAEASMVEREDSIIVSREETELESGTPLRRSSRRP